MKNQQQYSPHDSAIKDSLTASKAYENHIPIASNWIDNMVNLSLGSSSTTSSLSSLTSAEAKNLHEIYMYNYNFHRIDYDNIDWNEQFAPYKKRVLNTLICRFNK